ncbi:MAG: glycosyltransferase [Muribaculum sp.]|nr:glycosyltransferase [Muribaculum sp.]
MISIITVTYNAEKTLPATLKSVAEQTYKDYELIIIDGASRDNTLSLARSLAPNATILSEPDDGIYYAMNKGLRMAKGEYVLFLNAGDSFHSAGTLALYAEATQSGPDIIYGDTVVVDAERNELRPRHKSVPQMLTRESFSHGMLICHQAFMARRDLCPEYDTMYRFSADYDWTVKIIESTVPDKCVNLHAVTTDFLELGTTDKNHKASLAERFSIMRKHYGLSKTIMRHIGFLFRRNRN